MGLDKSIVFSGQDDNPLYAVHIDEILPIRVVGKCLERMYSKDQRTYYEKYKELKDIVFTVYRKKFDRKEYIVGNLVMVNGRPFFKPAFFDNLFLLVSESAIFDAEKFNRGSFFPYYADFNSPFNEVKITDLHNAYAINGYFSNYPIGYPTSMDMRNLVLNNPLCVEVESLKRLSLLEDDGVWEILFNKKFYHEYDSELSKRRLFAQKDLIHDYLNIDYYYNDLDPEETKAKRKEMISKL